MTALHIIAGAIFGVLTGKAIFDAADTIHHKRKDTR